MRPIARRALLLLASVLAPLSCAGAADYPTRPVELVVPFAAGGGTEELREAAAALRNGKPSIEGAPSRPIRLSNQHHALLK
jgi:tripartite-type tricarboxylate transporter receptor subunit TctC